MLKENKKNWIAVIGIMVIIFVSVVILFYLLSKNGHEKLLDLKRTSKNYSSKDEMINFLYDRYQVENGYKFSFVGSDIGDNYGLYYQNKKILFREFPDIYKNYILLDLINYDMYGYDEARNCYFYPLKEFKDVYFKYYGEVDSFNIDTSEKYLPRFYLDEDKICITKDEDNGQYHKVIDTYFVNGIYKNDEIIIYERVAFVQLNEKTIDFYQDYAMKNKVYSLDRDGADLSFIHQSKIVSNVLMQYKDKFSIYLYHYRKGEETYYLESITNR